MRKIYSKLNIYTTLNLKLTKDLYEIHSSKVSNSMLNRLAYLPTYLPYLMLLYYPSYFNYLPYFTYLPTTHGFLIIITYLPTHPLPTYLNNNFITTYLPTLYCSITQ
jgi:hypothetical protein